MKIELQLSKTTVELIRQSANERCSLNVKRISSQGNLFWDKEERDMAKKTLTHLPEGAQGVFSVPPDVASWVVKILDMILASKMGGPLFLDKNNEL